MRFIFVDAENVGVNVLSSIESTIADKVLVFSKSETIKEICERRLFVLLSGYSVGPNQADFYLIGNLVGIIASLTSEQKKQSEFILYSQDNGLREAFRFQCKLHNAKSVVALAPKAATKSLTVPPTQKISLDQKILAALSKPQSSEAVRKQLKAAKPDFTRAMNELIRASKIKRSQGCKKHWEAI